MGCVVVPENPSAVAYAVNRTGLIVVTQNPDEIHSATGAGAIAATERKGPCDHADDIAYIVITENPSPVTKSINHTDLIAITDKPREIHITTGTHTATTTESRSSSKQTTHLRYIVVTENPSPVTKAINHTDLTAITDKPREIHITTGTHTATTTESRSSSKQTTHLRYIVVTENPSPVTKAINHTDLTAITDKPREIHITTGAHTATTTEGRSQGKQPTGLCAAGVAHGQRRVENAAAAGASGAAQGPGPVEQPGSTGRTVRAERDRQPTESRVRVRCAQLHKLKAAERHTDIQSIERFSLGGHVDGRDRTARIRLKRLQHSLPRHQLSGHRRNPGVVARQGCHILGPHLFVVRFGGRDRRSIQTKQIRHREPDELSPVCRHHRRMHNRR
ncbi:hypothetical protein LAUMK42_01443 [Mycobacterium persicum]|uniref:Uncharacterized protein n=1 Tax=Mycobacterium persicum TaxID=1487726 RepID=A0AB38UPT2_9MYCO|nr:hypothetical protein LAUMK42_01443 [Mycobacterium persicum]